MSKEQLRVVPSDANESDPSRTTTLVHQQKILSFSPEAVLAVGSGPLFRHVDPDGDMWRGKGDREFRAFIKFENAMPRTPLVLLNLAGIDASHAQNLRLKLEVSGESREGFWATALTWGDSKIASVDVAWTAICQSTEARVAELTRSQDKKEKSADKSK